MTYIERTLKTTWERASTQFPVLLLTGPRQVGKSTFLQHVAGMSTGPGGGRKRRAGAVKRRAITLDDPALRALAQQDPKLFLQRFPPPITIDEIQYAPQLLPIIKMMVDKAKTPGMFWITGSQQFHLMKGVTESLAGRVGIMNMLGLSGAEARAHGATQVPFLPDAKWLQRQHPPGATTPRTYQDICRGWFPALVTGEADDRDLFLRSYLQTYLQRDVMDLAQVGDQSAFLRFVRACAARTGQLLVLSELARDADINVNTAKRWLSILETTFQVLLLEPFHNNITKRLIKAPKMYFLDTGLCAYLTQWATPEVLEAGNMSGQIFETFVVAEILKSWWNHGRAPFLHYYRDGDQREIDLLLIQDQTIYPVEIKKTAAPRPDHVAAAVALKRFPYKIADATIICLAQDGGPIAKGVNAVPAGWI